MMDVLPGASMPGRSATAKRPTCTVRSVPSGNCPAPLMVGAVGRVTPVVFIPDGCAGTLRREIAVPTGYA